MVQAEHAAAVGCAEILIIVAPSDTLADLTLLEMALRESEDSTDYQCVLDACETRPAVAAFERFRRNRCDRVILNKGDRFVEVHNRGPGPPSGVHGDRATHSRGHGGEEVEG